MEQDTSRWGGISTPIVLSAQEYQTTTIVNSLLTNMLWLKTISPFTVSIFVCYSLPVLFWFHVSSRCSWAFWFPFWLQMSRVRMFVKKEMQKPTWSVWDESSLEVMKCNSSSFCFLLTAVVPLGLSCLSSSSLFFFLPVLWSGSFKVFTWYHNEISMSTSLEFFWCLMA